MPTYEYSCKSCGEHLEVAQSFKDDALTECPACGGELRKVFGSIGIVFKGSGFYKNDSRVGHGAPKEPAAEAGAQSETATAPSGGEAAKPAAKPAAADGEKPAKKVASTPSSASPAPSSTSTSSTAAAS